MATAMSQLSLPMWASWGLLVSIPLMMMMSTLPEVALFMIVAGIVLLGIRFTVDASFDVLGRRFSRLLPFFSFARSSKGVLTGAILSLLGTRSLLAHGIIPIFSFLCPFHSRVSLRIYDVINANIVAIGLIGVAEMYCHIRSRRKGAIHQSTIAFKHEHTREEESSSAQNSQSSGAAPFSDLLDVTSWIHRSFGRGFGGAIVIDESTKRALTIEFYGPGLNNGINIEYSASANVNEAQEFTRFGHHSKKMYEKVVLQRQIFDNFVVLLQQNSSPATTFASNRRLYRGIIP